MGHRSGGRVEQVQIELKKRLFKMNVKTVSCVLALLFAAANARYIGAGASGQCNEIQFFPKCSSDQFIMNMMQCNRDIQSGYPYQSKGQCMSNADQWISCMQSKLAMCMSSNCPSILGSILGGMDQFMPVFNSFQGVNSLEQVYQTLDGVIDQVFTLFTINLPGQLDVIKQSGIKNWPVPLPGVNGLTIDQLATIFSQVGVPDALIAMFKDSPQLILYTSGCSDTYQKSTYHSQSQYSSNYQQSSYPSQYSSNNQQYQSGGYQSNYQSQYAAGNNYNDLENLLQGLLGNSGFGNILQDLFGGSYQSNYQPGYQSQYSSNYQQYPSSAYQQSNYQNQYAPANNYNNIGSLFQNLMGNIDFESIFQGLFGGSNMAGGSFQDIFGSLLQSFMGGSYPSGYQGSSSNYGSQSSGNQGSSSNYGSQSSGYQGSSSSGYQSQSSDSQSSSSPNY